MSAYDVIAAIALGVSVLSAGIATISLILGFRESSRRNEEIGHLRREGERRDEELSLLRQRVVGEKEERQRQRQARISVGERILADGSGRGIEYSVSVQNMGMYVAEDVKVDLVGADGRSAGMGSLGRALVPGETGTVTVMTPPHDRFFGPYTVFVEWRDGSGARREASGRTVGAP